MSAERALAQALLDPVQPVPPGIHTWNGSDPERRLAVHRNNVVVSLVDALAQTFPVTQALVGEDFFRAMAQVFVRAHPPTVCVLSGYGDALPGFIERFTPAATLPYLADVARLEMLRLHALHAADAPAMSEEAFARLVQDPQALSDRRWRLAPGLQVFRSTHAAVSLWAAHQDDSLMPLEDVATDQPESALVFRREWDVVVWQPPPGTEALVEQLQSGLPLPEACGHAMAEAPLFDTSLVLAGLMRHQLLVGTQAPA